MSVRMFISYTHSDGTTIKNVVDTFAPMERTKEVEILWDKKIDAGSDFWNEDIPEMMKSSDIVCLFLSTAYLASDSCQLGIEHYRTVNYQPVSLQCHFAKFLYS